MIIHEALCSQCDKREHALAPNSLYTNYRIPDHWLQLKGRDFCSNKCLKEFVRGLED